MDAIASQYYCLSDSSSDEELQVQEIITPPPLRRLKPPQNKSYGWNLASIHYHPAQQNDDHEGLDETYSTSSTTSSVRDQLDEIASQPHTPELLTEDVVVKREPKVANTRKYALSKASLPTNLVTFLSNVRTYFLKSVNFERQKAPITPSTFNKAEERMLCKF